MKIDSDVLEKAIGHRFDVSSYATLGMSDAVHVGGVLSFLDNPKYASVVNANPNIKGIFIKEADSCLIRNDVEKLIVDDPKWFFFSVVNYLGKNKKRVKSVISDTACIHPSAVISDVGVIIEDDVVIEPNVVVMCDVIIKKRTVIRAGAVIGVDGYEHKKTTKGVLSVVHDGVVIICEGVEVGVNSFVAKGFDYRATIVGAETKIDALVHYAHGVQCGKRCLIVANAMLGGNVTIGDDVWIGPSASIANRLTIGNGAFVTMGSVVTKSVKENEKVTGNFAIPHHLFLQNLKRSVSND